MAPARGRPKAASQRLGRRLGERLSVGAASGVLGGAVLGLIVGLMWSTPRAAGFWMALVGLTIFGGAFGALLGGYSSLESPDPGKEPSDTEHPVGDRPGLTREEHDPETPIE